MEVNVLWLKGRSQSSSLNSSSCSDSWGESWCSSCTSWGLSSGFSLMASATASTMGSIMAVVAVLEIHIERNMVVNMKPSISLAWLVPTIMMILKAILENISVRNCQPALTTDDLTCCGDHCAPQRWP